MNTLKEAMVPESIVGLWVDEGGLKERLEIEALTEGYPELAELIYQRAFRDVDLSDFD